MARWTRIAALAAAAAVLAGCASSPGDGSSPEPTVDVGEAALGTWRSTENPDVFMEFVEGGEYSGSDGCNGFGGTYTVEDDALLLEPGLSTLIACPDVDTWLNRSVRATVSGDVLETYDASGSRLGSLTREP